MSFIDYLSSPYLVFADIQTPQMDSPSLDQKLQLENEFCKDFNCCGQMLADLHQLLEHYEEYHSHNHDRAYNEDVNQYMKQQQKPKAPVTHTDLCTLENPQLNSLQIQTVGTISDDLPPTPGLSPTSSLSSEEYPWHSSSNSPPFSSSSKDDNSEDDLNDKPYRCDVQDCDKAYKNANGLKYHRLHGHCPPNENELDANKPFVCSAGNCRKRYKNLNGLKYHMEHTHSLKVALTSDMFIKNDNPHGLKRRFSSTSLSSSSSSE